MVNGIEYHIHYLHKKGKPPKVIRKELKKIMSKSLVPSLKVIKCRKFLGFIKFHIHFFRK